MNANNKGTLYGLLAYLCWGIFPIYFKLMQQVPALEILAHRLFWSFLLLIGILMLRKELPRFRTAVGGPRQMAMYFVAASLLSLNWLVYIWAVNAGFILEASLGYFINPLFNVLLGVVFLRERLRPLQWLPVGLAAAGVLYLTVSYGKLPWIALTLAISFGLYGLVKKQSSLGSYYGLTLETGLMFIPAVILLLVFEGQGTGALGHSDWPTTLLLVGTGIITTIPLLLFGVAARSIPLSTLGLLQYIAPTGQFLIGVLIYHEAFTLELLVGFALIWLALIIFWVEGYRQHRRLAATI